MKQLKTIFFSLVMLLYLWVPFSMIHQQEEILEDGEIHRFRLAPVDPYDAFRGRYVVLSFGAIKFNKKQSDQAHSAAEQIYLLLAKDSSDYSYFSGYSFTPPENKTYITSEVQYITDQEVIAKLPENMRRYYMNEALAPLAEQLYRNQRRAGNEEQQQKPIYAEISVLEGQTQIRKLYFGEETISTYLRRTLAREAE